MSKKWQSLKRMEICINDFVKNQKEDTLEEIKKCAIEYKRERSESWNEFEDKQIQGKCVRFFNEACVKGWLNVLNIFLSQEMLSVFNMHDWLKDCGYEAIKMAAMNQQIKVIQWFDENKEFKRGHGEISTLSWSSIAIEMALGPLKDVRWIIEKINQMPQQEGEAGDWSWQNEEVKENMKTMFKKACFYRNKDVVRWWIMEHEVDDDLKREVIHKNKEKMKNRSGGWVELEECFRIKEEWSLLTEAMGLKKVEDKECQGVNIEKERGLLNEVNEIQKTGKNANKLKL